MEETVTRSPGLWIATVIFVLLLTIIACGVKATAPAAQGPAGKGNIVFTANGEDFVRQGFTDKQGWKISFERLYVNIVDPTAYKPGGESPAALKGAHWIDLAAGDAAAAPLVVGSLPEVSAGNYQSLRFSIRRAAAGALEGFSIVMIGQAAGKGENIGFTIKLDEEMDFHGRDGYVGDEVKGLLKPGESAEVEMTFHFDHIFGDIEAAQDDHINTGSVGFDFFRLFAEGNTVDVTQEEMKKTAGYSTLVKAVWSLGHLGEGHCDVSAQSSKGEI